MAAKVYDAAGNPIEVEGIDASAIVQGSGRISVVGPDGWRGTIPAEELPNALTMGYRTETTAEHGERALSQSYDNPALAAAAGAASTVTGGLSDAFASVFDDPSDPTRERPIGVPLGRGGPAELYRQNPTAGTVGKVAGALLPVGLPGVAAGVGRTAGAAAAELAPGAIGRVVGAGARAGTEGAVFGLGEGLSQVALADHPMAPEAVIAELGGNALRGAGYGLLLGGGFGVAGEGVRAGFGAAKSAAGALRETLETRAAARVEDAADDVERLTHPAQVRAAMRAEQATLEEAAAKSREATKAAVRVEEEALSAGQLQARESIADDVTSFRNSIGSDKYKIAQQMKKTEKGIAVDYIDSEKRLSRLAGSSRRMVRSPAEAADALQSQESALTRFQQRLDEAEALHKQVTREETVARARAQLAEVDEVLPGVQAEIARREAAIAAGATGKAGARPLKAMKQREGLLQRRQNLLDEIGDAQLSKKGQRPLEAPQISLAEIDWSRTRTTKMLSSIRALEDRLDATLAARGSARLEELSAQLAAPAKLTSPRLERLQTRLDMLSSPAGQFARQSADQIRTLVGTTIGGALGSAVGMPFVGAGLGAMGARLLSERGRDLIRGGAGQLVARMHGSVAKAVDGFVSAGKAVAAKAPTAATRAAISVGAGRPPSDRTEALMDKARDLAANVGPDGKITMDARRAIYSNLDGLREADVRLADRAETVAVRKAEFLATKAPKDPGLGTPLNRNRWRPSETQLREFATYVATADRPERLLEEIRSGRISPKTVEAAKTIYPEFFQSLVLQMTQRLAERGKDVSYPKRIQLSILLGVPFDSTMRPEYIAWVQQIYADKQAQQQQPPGGARPKVPPMKAPQPTTAQRMSG